MKALFQKIKSLYALINRGILKVSDWMIGGFRVALVFGVVLYAVGIGWFVLYADKVSLEDHTVLVMDLKGVPAVGDHLRDLQAAIAVGCEPHLVMTGKGAQYKGQSNLPKDFPANTQAHLDHLCIRRLATSQNPSGS